MHYLYFKYKFKVPKNTDHIYRDISITHVLYLYHDKYGPCFSAPLSLYFMYKKCIKHMPLCACFSIFYAYYIIMVPKVRKGLP